MTVLDPPGTSTIVLSGEYDVANAAWILGQVSQALRDGATAVALDMAAVTFMDSTVLAALVQSRRACIDQSATLILARPSHQVQRVLAYGGLAPVFLPPAAAAI